jgi:hypothetical protein
VHFIQPGTLCLPPDVYRRTIQPKKRMEWPMTCGHAMSTAQGHRRRITSPIFFDVTFARISLIRCRPHLKWRAELFDDGWLVDSILLEIWWKYYTPSVGIGCPIYRLSIAGGGNVPTTCCFVISTHRQLRREEDERLNFFLDRRALKSVPLAYCDSLSAFQLLWYGIYSLTELRWP